MTNLKRSLDLEVFAQELSSLLKHHHDTGASKVAAHTLADHILTALRRTMELSPPPVEAEPLPTRPSLRPAPVRSELDALFEKARTRQMTPEERAAQAHSWVRGELGLAHPDWSAEKLDALVAEGAERERRRDESSPTRSAESELFRLYGIRGADDLGVGEVEELLTVGERLAADNARLRKALAPFAGFRIHAGLSDDYVITGYFQDHLTAGDIRRAIDALHFDGGRRDE